MYCELPFLYTKVYFTFIYSINFKLKLKIFDGQTRQIFMFSNSNIFENLLIRFNYYNLFINSCSKYILP